MKTSYEFKTEQEIEKASEKPLAEHTANQHGREAELLDNFHAYLLHGREEVTTSPPIDRGNATSYLLRRIARDQPELLDDMGPGKPHRSVRAAAIAAGIIKPVPIVLLVDDPAKIAASIKKHLSPEQITEPRCSAPYRGMHAHGNTSEATPHPLLGPPATETSEA